MNVDAFLNMGGYAIFIWPAFGVVTLGLLALGYGSWSSMKKLDAEAQRLKAKRNKEMGR